MFLGFVKVKVFRDNQLLLCQFFTVREFEVERAGSLPSCAISSSGLSSDIRQASENLIRGTVQEMMLGKLQCSCTKREDR